MLDWGAAEPFRECVLRVPLLGDGVCMLVVADSALVLVRVLEGDGARWTIGNHPPGPGRAAFVEALRSFADTLNGRGVLLAVGVDPRNIH